MNKQLTPLQLRAVESLTVCTSIPSAAKHAGVGERTLYRWLQEEEFQSAIRRVRQLSLTQLATHLQHMAGRAAGTLDEIMEDKNATSASRVSAARYSMGGSYGGGVRGEFGDGARTPEHKAGKSRKSDTKVGGGQATTFQSAGRPATVTWLNFK